MLTFIMNALPTIIVLGILIFIHELGHFIIAKVSGVAVEKFSLGFGPVLLQFKRKETVYALSLIPFGGFVKMAGETLEDTDESALKESDFLAQGIVKRFLIIFAGPVMNYVLAVVLLVAVFIAGRPALAPIIGDLVENYPAQVAGLKSGDRVLSVDGNIVATWDELRKSISTSTLELVTLKVQRDSSERSIEIAPQTVTERNLFGDTQTVKKIGIYPSDETIFIKYNFVDAVREAFSTTFTITTLTCKSIIRLITGRLHPKALSGPLGIMVITSKTAKRGFIYLVQLTAFLSISLAIFNLLPIPALDGGHIFFILCEAIVRKPIPFKLQERVAQVGFILLMVLMVFVIYNDAINFEIIDKIKRFVPSLK